MNGSREKRWFWPTWLMGPFLGPDLFEKSPLNVGVCEVDPLSSSGILLVFPQPVSKMVLFYHESIGPIA